MSKERQIPRICYGKTFSGWWGGSERQREAQLQGRGARLYHDAGKRRVCGGRYGLIIVTA